MRRMIASGLTGSCLAMAGYPIYDRVAQHVNGGNLLLLFFAIIVVNLCIGPIVPEDKA